MLCLKITYFEFKLINIDMGKKNIGQNCIFCEKHSFFWWVILLCFGRKSTFLLKKKSRFPCYFQTKFSENLNKKSVTNRHILKSFSKYSPYPPKNINFFLKKSDFWGKVEFQLWGKVRVKNHFFKLCWEVIF